MTDVSIGPQREGYKMSTLNDDHLAQLNFFFNETVISRRHSIVAAAESENPLQVLLDWVNDMNESARLRDLFPVLDEEHIISRGLHSTAYIYETCVVKTNVFDENFRDGQMSWLKWCNGNQNKHNPFVPKIMALYVDEETERFLVVMEKLEAHSGFEQHSFRMEIDDALKEAFRRPGRWPALRKVMAVIRNEIAISSLELVKEIAQLDPVEDDEMIDILKQSLAEHQITLRYINELKAFDARITDHDRYFFKAVMNKLYAAATVGQVIDVHAFNWMKRQNGDFVLLDPIN